jgi:hypothetical protein
MVEVYRAAGEIEAQVIRSLPNSHSILCLIKSSAAPSVHIFTIDELGEFSIMVPVTIVKITKQLLAGEDHA